MTAVLCLNCGRALVAEDAASLQRRVQAHVDVECRPNIALAPLPRGLPN